MFSRSMAWSNLMRCAVVLIVVVMLGVSSCGDEQKKPEKKAKHQKPINCDTDISVDVNNGPSVDPVYLCVGDNLTWVPATQDTTFVITFINGASPFQDGKSQFNEQDASHPAKDQYQQLTALKYSITVTKAKPTPVSRTYDPQVIAGGNP